MDQKDNLEFNLEDILREFGGSAEEVPQIEAEPEEPEKPPVLIIEPMVESVEALMEKPKEEPEEKPKDESTPTPVTGDTIRLDQIQAAVADKMGEHPDATMAFAPVHIEEESDAEEPQVAPFSEEWEPEYEETMENFPIPEPIVFRPKSRLKELRQKLVSGPEQRYYSLMELGVGKLQIAILLNLVVFLLSAGSTVLYACGMVPDHRLRLLVFVQCLAMLLSALLGCYRMMDGVRDILKRRFTLNSLLAVTFCVCCLDGVLCLEELRVPCCAAFSLQMTMSLWATYDRRSTEMGQMDTLRRAIMLDSLTRIDDYYEGRPGYQVGRGEVEHFMDHYAETPGPERLLNWYALASLSAAVLIGVMGGILHGFSTGVQVCAAALLVGMPATAFLSTVRPMAILEKRLHKLGTVLCGWTGIKAVTRRAAYPLTDSDLFPSGSAKLNGVKFYGDRDPDEVVSYATALIQENGGALVNLFTQLRDSRGGYEYSVENLNCYAGGGIGGEICDDAVLVGTLQFMQDMGVDMGEGTRVSQAVYCAIDGELCGVFAVTYNKAKSSASGLRTISTYRGLTPVMITEDFMLTEGFIRSKFGINTRRMAFPERSARQELAEREAEETDTVVALVTKEGLASKAFALTGARVLKSAMKTGVIVHMVGGILGLLIMAALAYVGAAELLTPANVLLYELVWMLPGLLITEWTRSI